MAKTILGKIYVGDNETVIFVINDGISQICLMNNECDCKVLIDDNGSEKPLNFNEHHQITGIYRLRRGCEKTIYFTDNYNPPRYLNLSDINSFREIINTSPLIEYGALDTDKMLLQKVYDKIPNISLEIGENGQLLSGSYNVAARYVDEDLNPTEWMQPTEPIMIWQSDAIQFNEVRASTNEDVEYRKYGPTHKSIRVSVRNTECDHSYIFIQFALIAATTGTGIVNDVVYSPLIELDFNKNDNFEYEEVNLTYNFTGGSDVTTGSEDEILANTEVFDRVKCIEQADNRLTMGNVTDMNIDWCKLQKYASRIVTDCVTKKVDLTDYSAKDNPKNPMVLYNNGVGYQPGEIYSFGIVYVFENGVKSPVYHIPGRSRNETPGVPLCGGHLAMQQYNNECRNMKYSEVAMACEGFKYWGCDDLGYELDGELIRHHRFPYKPIPNPEDPTQETTILYHYNLYVGKIRGTIIKGKFKRHCNFILIKYEVTDELNDLTNEEFEHEVNLNDLNGCQRYIVPGYDNINNSTIGVEDNNDRDIPFIWEWYVNNSNIQRGNRLKFSKNKYKKIKDIYVSKNAGVKFDYIQEWPQLIKIDVGVFSSSSWVTTGGTMAAELSKDAQAAIYALVITGSVLPGGFTGAAIVLYLKYKEQLNNEVESFDERKFKNTSILINNDRFKNYAIVHYRNTNLKTRNLKFKLGNSQNEFYSGNLNDAPAISSEEYYFNNYGNTWTANQLHLNSNITFRVERFAEEITTRTADRKTDILGIKFGNVQIPNSKYLNGHKIIGYYFVQNERTKEDMTVLDSAILTPLFNEKDNIYNNKIITSGRIFADDTYYDDIDNSYFNNKDYPFLYSGKYKKGLEMLANEKPKETNLIERLSKQAIGFINPRFKFNREELYFTKFVHIGDYILVPSYRTAGRNHPEHTCKYSTNCDDLWITEDVQAGSSYNKKINSKKDRDDDGFDLHVYHKESFVKYVPCAQQEYEIHKESIHYLLPSSEITETLNNRPQNIYNVSGDNNQGVIVDNDLPFITRNLFVGSYTDDSDDNIGLRIDKLPYGYFLRDLDDYYVDFGNRPYYIISDLIRVDDPKYLQIEKCNVFRGDCFNSVIKYTTGIQYDVRIKTRGKKNTVWMYIVGSLGVVGGVVGSFFTAGATSVLVGPSIALIQNGIRTDVAFNTMKKFNDSNGKECLTDVWVKNLIDVNQDDDEIQWLFESVDNLIFESVLNINWRVGTSISDITDYLDPYKYNPSELKQYFQKKLTYADAEHKDGRMYRGFALAEIYDINKDFQRRNKQKIYYCIPITHKCCSECENSFPKRIVYSQQSFAEERTDNYKVFLPGNYIDINGETGDVTNISYQGQDAFMIFTEEGLWQIAPSRQQHVNPVTQVVSFLGTGDFFKTLPQRIIKNDVNICFGSAHQTSFCNTPIGLFWYSEHDNAIYTFIDKMPVDIFKQAGMGKFFEREGRLKTDRDWYRQYRTKYPFKDNPSSELGTGYVLGWDHRYERLLITKKDNRCSFMSECFYDSDQRQKEVVLAKINELNNQGKFNICYHWDKERCCYIIDFDTKRLISEPITYNHTDVTYLNSALTTVLYITDIEYYYDSLEKSSCGIADIIVATIADSIKGNLIIVSSDDIYLKFAKYYPNSIHYSTDDNIDVTDIYTFIMKDWSSITGIDSGNLSYIIFTSNVDTFNVKDNPNVTSTIITLSQSYNFNLSIYPILKKEIEKFNYSNLNDFMIDENVTFDDYNDLLVTDEYCYILDKIDLSDTTKRMYKSNINDYKELLINVKEEINIIQEHINNDEFEVSMFDDLLSLISLYNTYNYWNLLKNAYNFNNFDLFNNGNYNLLMFKDTSDTFNSFALSYLGKDWYDISADYDNLASNMNNCTDVLMEAVNGIDTKLKMVDFIEDLFKKLYARYVDTLESVVYGGDNLTTMKNLAAMFSPNIKSIPFKENNITIPYTSYDTIQSYVESNLPLGNEIYLPITIHNNIYIEDFVNKREIINLFKTKVLSDLIINKDFSTVISKTVSPISIIRERYEYEDGRIYLPNIEADIIDTDVNKLNDNSFTISYKPNLGFISFHSYMPSIYIWTPDSLHTWRVGDNFVYRHNVKGSYQRFYEDFYPFVLELVDKNPNLVVGPQIIDSISLLSQADQFIGDEYREVRNVFFDNVYFYNSKQCSLFSKISVKKELSKENYFAQYLNNESSMDVISAEKRESLWHINHIRDFRVDYDNAIHLTDLDDRENFMWEHDMNGWIDKALNENILDKNKDWWDLEPFRDNFICQRYFYNPKCDTGIRLKVLLVTTAKAQSNDNTLK